MSKEETVCLTSPIEEESTADQVFNVPISSDLPKSEVPQADHSAPASREVNVMVSENVMVDNDQKRAMEEISPVTITYGVDQAVTVAIAAFYSRAVHLIRNAMPQGSTDFMVEFVKWHTPPYVMVGVSEENVALLLKRLRMIGKVSDNVRRILNEYLKKRGYKVGRKTDVTAAKSLRKVLLGNRRLTKEDIANAVFLATTPGVVNCTIKKETTVYHIDRSKNSSILVDSVVCLICMILNQLRDNLRKQHGVSMTKNEVFKMVVGVVASVFEIEAISEAAKRIMTTSCCEYEVDANSTNIRKIINEVFKYLLSLSSDVRVEEKDQDALSMLMWKLFTVKEYLWLCFSEAKVIDLDESNYESSALVREASRYDSEREFEVLILTIVIAMDDPCRRAEFAQKAGLKVDDIPVERKARMAWMKQRIGERKILSVAEHSMYSQYGAFSTEARMIILDDGESEEEDYHLQTPAEEALAAQRQSSDDDMAPIPAKRRRI